MSTPRLNGPVSRRSALAGLSAGGFGVALVTRQTDAFQATPDMAAHPMVGTWLSGRAPNDIAVTHVGPDGSFFVNGPNVSLDEDGTLIGFGDPSLGSWVPEGDRGIRFHFTNRTYDATGAHTGYFSVEGHPVSSEDGMSFWDDGTQVVLTIRDPNGVVVETLGPGLEGAAIGGVRLVPGESGYEEMLAMLAAQPSATPDAGTPTA